MKVAVKAQSFFLSVIFELHILGLIFSAAKDMCVRLVKLHLRTKYYILTSVCHRLGVDEGLRDPAGRE